MAATAIDQGRLGRVFAQQIAPHVAELDRERRRLRNELAAWLAVVVPIAAAPAGLLAAFVAPLTLVAVALVAPAGLAALLLYRMWALRYRRLVRERVMPPVCAALGGVLHREEPGAGFDLERFARLGLIRSTGTRRRLEDHFSGYHRGTGFEMVEARIVQGSGKHQSTVFRGLLFAIDVPVGFIGEVVIARDRGRIGNAIASAFGARSRRTRIAFDHPAFERLYEVHADIEGEARRLLTPALLDTLVALAESHRGRALRAAFNGGRFLLALPLRRNLFEVGGLFTPAAKLESELHRLVDEIGVAHRLIDFLHGDRPGRLA